MNIKSYIYGLATMAIFSLTACESSYDPFSNGSDAGRDALNSPAVGTIDSLTSANSLALSWNKVDGANEYAVVIYDSLGEVFAERVSAENSVRVVACQPNSKYTAKVTAYSPVESSAKKYSSETITVQGTTKSVTLSSEVNGPKAKVSWQGFDSYVNAYNVTVFDAEGKELTTEIVTSPSATYNATALGNYKVVLNGYYIGYYNRSGVDYYTAYVPLTGLEKAFTVNELVSYPFDVTGTIYRLGIGDNISGTLHAEKADDGTITYTLYNWYGPGSKNLTFTLSSTGAMNITPYSRKGVYYTDGGYTYYYTGLEETNVYFLSGYSGYDVASVYDKAAVDAGNWTGIGAIDPSVGFYIYIKGYYGAYSYTPWTVVKDPNGYKYWTFEYNPQ